MAHTDRQPSDEIFKDIKNAAEKVWYTSDHHEEYIKEKVEARERIENYADNWCGFIQQFDSRNQLMFFEYLRLQASVDFLIEQHAHYSYFIPNPKH